MFDLPETLEEILIWRLEQVAGPDSYFTMLSREHPQYTHIQIITILKHWVRSIVHLEGAVTHTQTAQYLSYTGQRLTMYHVAVGSVPVLRLNSVELDMLYQLKQ